MSRGPGRIERAIRALFDTHPDDAFTPDELVEHCYPGINAIERKHQVAVLRAARNVIKGDPDWGCLKGLGDRRKVVFCNQASVPSRTAHVDQAGCYSVEVPAWQQRIKDEVRLHTALRDATPTEAARLRAEHAAAEAAREAECDAARARIVELYG